MVAVRKKAAPTECIRKLFADPFPRTVDGIFERSKGDTEHERRVRFSLQRRRRRRTDPRKSRWATCALSVAPEHIVENHFRRRVEKIR